VTTAYEGLGDWLAREESIYCSVTFAVRGKGFLATAHNSSSTYAVGAGSTMDRAAESLMLAINNRRQHTE